MEKIYFDLENENGFFCMFFFVLSSYIYAQKTNKLLGIISNKWKFSYENGFNDYFILNKTLTCVNDRNEVIGKEIFTHMKEPDMLHSLNDYRMYSKELYKIQRDIIDYRKIIELPLKYNSIFIRGGDKLLYEAVQHPISEYVCFLLNLNSNINNLFIHSDDNLLVERVEEYININNIKLNIFKITDNTCNGGAVVMERLKYGACKNIKSVDSMDKNEVKTHTKRMLCAIEIMRNSENVVLSYDSNASRFMKINFECNVHSINHDNDLNYTKKTQNPAFGF